MFEKNLYKKEGNGGKTIAVSLAALAAAVPAFWLGGCLATHRPAWFMRRSTAERIREELQDRLEAMRRQTKKGVFDFLKH